MTSNILIDYLHLVWAYFWPKSNIHLCLSSDDLDTNVDPMLPRLSKFYHMKSVHMFLSLTMSVFDISHQNSLSEEFLIARSLRNFKFSNTAGSFCPDSGYLPFIFTFHSYYIFSS